MENEKDYFKRPTLGEYIRASLLTVTLLVLFYISFLPVIDILRWCSNRSEPFVLFTGRLDVALYCIFVTFFLVREYKRFQCLYFRMQEVPLLTLTEEKICIDRAMVKFPRGTEWAGKITLAWSDIKQIEVGLNSFVIYFVEEGKESREKINLRWVEKKEMLLSALETECRENKITWVERYILYQRN